jgi:hypothetical protein
MDKSGALKLAIHRAGDFLVEKHRSVVIAKLKTLRLRFDDNPVLRLNRVCHKLDLFPQQPLILNPDSAPKATITIPLGQYLLCP